MIIAADSKEKRSKGGSCGGVTGGFLPPELADTPKDYESLLNAGVLMGQASLLHMTSRLV
ncbi:MAG: hypothetical protein Ct9H300mP23_04450 [Nitrospinota bacterium]|nr:MAG: hypothetical protein Ct9H300mP23_04450 [Nitrospinota bacterium]